VPNEIVLFWVVAAGFLIADNLVLLPPGGDFLRFGRAGRLVYVPAARLEARGCDLVLLNPLNLFHRAALTTRSLGPVDRQGFRASRRQLLTALPSMNLFSCIGYAYLGAAAVVASLSFAVHFGSVLASFLAVHLVFWAVTAGLLVRRRRALSLSGYQAFVFVVEGMLVPAYTINLGKRLWAKQRLDLPALTLGLRQAKRMPKDPDRELYLQQLRERLNVLESQLPDEANDGAPAARAAPHKGEPLPARPVSQRDLVQEAKACLMT
jgi:uncharacterized membrane protein YhaH (DUF805 family)